jgi:ribosome-associated toxin RatA of RatAB toxin-antitoxin module
MRALAVILVLTAGALAPVVASDRGVADVTVKEERGIYRVAASFDVPQSPGTALGVLKDYERIPRFMPDLRTSVVRERVGRQVIVEQEAVSKMLMFSKRVHLLLEVTEEPGALRFVDRCGRSFTLYRGAWIAESRDGRTQIRYELEARPAFSVPEVLLRRLLRRDATQMIERLRQEIAERVR